MLGCMIESSVSITAAAHLAPLVDVADLDGALLIKDDPFDGATFDGGRIRLPDAPGLGVTPHGKPPRTQGGPYVLNVSAWRETFATEIRSLRQYQSVLIGGNLARPEITVTGSVKNEQILEELKVFIDGKNPPYQLVWKVEIDPKCSSAGSG